MTKPSTYDQITVVLGLLVLFLISLLYWSSMAAPLQFNQINEEHPISDLVFSSQPVSNHVAYLDSFYGPRPTHRNQVLSADVFVLAENQHPSSWLSLTSNSQFRPSLKENELAISQNLGFRYGISLGTEITLKNQPWTVVYFLPTLKGFHPETKREGIILTAYASELFLEAEGYLYFNLNPQASFSDSLIVRASEYVNLFSFQNTISTIVYFFVLNNAAWLMLINMRLLNRKMAVWTKERIQFLHRFKGVVKQAIIPFLVAQLLSSLLLFVVLSLTYDRGIFFPLLISTISFIVCSNVAAMIFILLKQKKRIIYGK